MKLKRMTFMCLVVTDWYDHWGDPTEYALSVIDQINELITDNRVGSQPQLAALDDPMIEMGEAE